MWQLHFLLIIMVLGLFADALPLLGLLIYIPIVPGLAMSVRRMHDTGHRIWWLFIPLVGSIMCFIWSCSATNVEETRWARTTRS